MQSNLLYRPEVSKDLDAHSTGTSIEDILTQVSDVKSDQETMKKTLSILQTDLEKKNQIIFNLQITIDGMKKTIDDLNSTISILRHTIDGLISSLAQNKQENISLVDTLKTQITQLERSISENEEKYNKLKQEYNEGITSREKLEINFSKLEANARARELYNALKKNDTAIFTGLTKECGPAIFLTKLDALDDQTLLEYAILQGYHLSSNPAHQQMMNNMISYAEILAANQFNLKAYMEQCKSRLNTMLRLSAVGELPHVLRLYRMHQYGTQAPEVQYESLSKIIPDKIKLGKLSEKTIDEKLIRANSIYNDNSLEYQFKGLTNGNGTPILSHHSISSSDWKLNEYLIKALSTNNSYLSESIIPRFIFDAINCQAMNLDVVIDIRISLRRGWKWQAYNLNPKVPPNEPLPPFWFSATSDVYYQFDFCAELPDSSINTNLLFSSIFKFAPNGKDPFNRSDNTIPEGIPYTQYQARHNQIAQNLPAYAKENWDKAEFLQTIIPNSCKELEAALNKYLAEKCKHPGTTAVKGIEKIYPQTCSVAPAPAIHNTHDIDVKKLTLSSYEHHRQCSQYNSKVDIDSKYTPNKFSSLST